MNLEKRNKMMRAIKQLALSEKGNNILSGLLKVVKQDLPMLHYTDEMALYDLILLVLTEPVALWNAIESVILE